MVDNKKSEVNDFKDFSEKLNQAGHDKAQLVKLARDVICASNSHRTFSERKACRDVIVNPDTLKINALYAVAKRHSPDFSTKDKLHMIMDSYVKLATEGNPKMDKKKALDGFCKEFAATYPQEYGVEPQKRVAENNQSLNPALMQKVRSKISVY